MTLGSSNIFADLGFAGEDAQNLLLRSQTMTAIATWFQSNDLTQAAAAKTLGITQPRFNQLLKGKINEFSLDALVNMATRAGMHVSLTIMALLRLPRLPPPLQQTNSCQPGVEAIALDTPQASL